MRRGSRRFGPCAGEHDADEDRPKGRFRAIPDDFYCDRCYPRVGRLGHPQDVVAGDELHTRRNTRLDVSAEAKEDRKLLEREDEDEDEEPAWDQATSSESSRTPPTRRSR